MSICGIKQLLSNIKNENRAVGAFNIGNMEMLIGVIKASEESNTPVIIQVAEKRLLHCPLDFIAPVMVNVAKKSKVDIAVQLDHGFTMDNIYKSIDYGFTSIMYDGSEFPLKENIENTNKVYDITSKYGLDLEAEIGVLSGDEGGGDMSSIYTNPEDARNFSLLANFDALAVSIGNAHGHYSGKPNLNFEILKEIRNVVNTPLVLHGGTGLSPEDFKLAILNGIRKINIATGNFEAIVKGALEYFESSKNINYFSLNEHMVEKVYESTKFYIDIFN